MRIVSVFIASLALLTVTGTAQAAPDRAERQQEIRKMAEETLARLYEVNPSARKAVQRAAGHAVFSSFGMKILVAGGGTGKGIVVDHKTKQETFMRMAEVQAGLGMGVKKFRLVWVFEKRTDLERFIDSGWELGAQTTVAATTGGAGAELFAGAMAITPGVWLYQITDEGLAVELTAKGTKYYKDPDLN